MRVVVALLFLLVGGARAEAEIASDAGANTALAKAHAAVALATLDAESDEPSPDASSDEASSTFDDSDAEDTARADVASAQEATEQANGEDPDEAVDGLVDGDDESGDGDDESGADAFAEAEDHTEGDGESGGHRYTADLSDEELERLWRESPEALGTLSVGFADAGRLINAEACRPGDAWIITSPAQCYGTQETLEFLYTAINHVAEEFPDTRPIRINHISAKDGGWLRPHFSHQSGRDADIGFYYKDGIEYGWGRKRENQIDVARNWAFVKALLIHTDVQVILVDQRISRVLRAHALEQGEDPAWLERVFASGRQSLVRHARGHHHHFHVRFYNARAQELGRRIAPLLAEQPEQNFAMHRVRPGNTLGHIARAYGSTVREIQRANGMKNSFLRLGRVLKVPLRKPCTKCPLPPEVIVPDRCLPPDKLAHASSPEDSERTDVHVRKEQDE